MCWCRQATSHCLSQCWPRSMSQCWPRLMLQYGVIRPQWLDIKLLCITAQPNLMISYESPIYIVCLFITKSFLTYSFFPPTLALSTVSRPLSSSMCSITPETANVCRSYNRIRGPGIGSWFSYILIYILIYITGAGTSFLCFMTNHIVDQRICQWNDPSRYDSKLWDIQHIKVSERSNAKNAPFHMTELFEVQSQFY